MSHKKTKKINITPDSEAFLRSINICYDCESPDRIEHFQPTSKSTALLQALLESDKKHAFFITAPYGSGKSLTAAYALHLVEKNESSMQMLKAVNKRMEGVNPTFAKWTQSRLRKKSSGLVIALHGFQENTPQAIKKALIDSMQRAKLGREARPLYDMEVNSTSSLVKFLAETKKRLQLNKCDRILLLWDEFGQHIQSLIQRGTASDLIEIQQLAEYASRSKKQPFDIALILHQGLLQYANNLPQSVRNEWTKISGRFESIQYVDDSSELYRLLAEVTAAKVGSVKTPAKKVFKDAAQKALKLGMFKGISVTVLSDILKRAFPLSPAVLYLLPRISARVAQNERTLFTFISSSELTNVIYPETLYDYFTPEMRADTSTGGVYRQWVETESALSKTTGKSIDEQILKTACLLGMGTDGERTRTSVSCLQFACEGYTSSSSVKANIEALIQQKLLLHRKHSNDVTIWHGTDIDLRGRLLEARESMRNDFRVSEFLSKDAPPPVGKPLEYNDEFSIRRYFQPEYRTIAELDTFFENPSAALELPKDCDGRIVYLIPENQDEINRAEVIAKNHLKHPQVVVVMPRTPIAISEAALDAWCLLQLQQDSALIDSDPLALTELMQMSDDARGHLQKLVDRLTMPSYGTARFFCNGNEFVCKTEAELRRHLSLYMKDVFPDTPHINNEMIVRKKPSAVVVNARKKLTLAIMERHGCEDLGLEGFTPDVSMFRTVLLLTGLYTKDEKGQWRYANPSDLKDQGLSKAWAIIEDFFITPDPKGKPLSQLISNLQRPPLGIRSGLLPILFAAGLKAFPVCISLIRDGEYVNDILPSEVELIFREPERYAVKVLDIKPNVQSYLQGVYKIFSSGPDYNVESADLIRLCFEAIEAWKSQLPRAALNTSGVKENTAKVRDVLHRYTDPVQMLLEDIPAALGIDKERCNQAVEQLEAVKHELDQIVKVFEKQAEQAIRKVLGFSAKNKSVNVRTLVRDWASCFPEEFMSHFTDNVAKGLISRMLMDYRKDSLLLESLSELLLGRPLSRWDDRTIRPFEQALNDKVHLIEENALDANVKSLGRGAAIDGIKNIITGRINELYDRLVKLVGEETAKQAIQQSSNIHARTGDS